MIMVRRGGGGGGATISSLQGLLIFENYVALQELTFAVKIGFEIVDGCR